jgi:hypothetical protein
MLMHRSCVAEIADSGEPDRNRIFLPTGITDPGYNVNEKAVTRPALTPDECPAFDIENSTS